MNSAGDGAFRVKYSSPFFRTNYLDTPLMSSDAGLGLLAIPAGFLFILAAVAALFLFI